MQMSGWGGGGAFQVVGSDGGQNKTKKMRPVPSERHGAAATAAAATAADFEALECVQVLTPLLLILLLLKR